MQGTSSDFEVVSTEEQSSPPETGSRPRNMMVSRQAASLSIPSVFSLCYLPFRTGATQIPWVPWSYMGDMEGLEHGVLLALICKSPTGDFPSLGHTGTPLL